MIKKFSALWASSGDTGTAPTATKQETGFVRRERPNRQLFNWVINALQSSLNDAAGSVSPVNDGIDTPAQQIAIATGVHEYPWAMPEDAGNTIDVGTGAAVFRVQACFISNEPHIMALDKTNNVVKLYNARTKELIDTSHDLTGDITGTTPQALDFCTDGSNIYVLFHNASNELKVGKFLIGGTWSYDVSWTAGGQQVGSELSILEERTYMIYNGDYLIISRPWELTNGYIAVLNGSDGTIYAQGNGDSTSAPVGAISTYGDYVFFSSDSGDICSFDIETPTAGTGGAAYPAGVSYAAGNVAIGGNIFTAMNYTDPADSNPIVYHSTVSNATLNRILAGTPDNGAPSKYTLYGGCRDLTTDGQNIWIGTKIEVSVGTTRCAVVGFDASKISNSQNITIGTLDLTQIVRGPYLLPESPGTNDDGPRLCFDGRDMWTCNQGQYLYRIPRIALR